MTPEEDGRAAAKKGTPFKACPYTYENSKAESVEAYIAGGFGLQRDQWFDGWEKECKRIAVAENRKALKAPNAEITGD